MNQSNKLLSDITAFRTYAKYLQHLGRRESFEETINRNMQMHLDKFPKLSRDIIKAYQKVHELKVMPSMRGLQFAGEAILKNPIRQYNCSYAAIDDVQVFGEAIFLLLSGVGFGFSVQKIHINKLPKIVKPREEGMFIVQDSIEGWAQAVDTLMNSYFHGRVRPQFDFGNVRPKGSYLVTTGAKAPGPEPLKKMLELVEDKLKQAIGRKLRPIEIHDIICMISDSVLAGGIRRAALISLFDKDDEEMLKCKHGEWWNYAPWRARANNSAVLNRQTTTKEEFDHIFKMCKDSGSGEPGFSWTNDNSGGFNPCVVGETEILTKDGYKRIDSLVDQNVEIWNGFEWSKVTPKVTGHNQDIIEVTTNNGNVLKCTTYHKFYLLDVYKDQVSQTNTSTIAKELKLGDQLIQWNDLNGQVVNDYIVGLKYIGKADIVYCFNEPKHHTGIFNGIITGQCHEIALNSNQFCNLSTVNQTDITSEKDFLNRVYSASLIGTLQASYTDFHYVRPSWKEITEKEALLGVSFTGIADGKNNINAQLLKKAAQLVLDVNEKYARKLGINLAARTTAVKPEGTTSCVLGSSSGIHARHSEYYIRRIRMNKDDALGVYLKYIVPDLVEDDIMNSNGIVISIPQKSPENSITREKETATTLLNRALYYNRHWVANGHRFGNNKHNVSVTISVKDHEWDELRELMWNNKDIYSGISLLPYDGGNYIQAPFEEISESKYNEMIKLVKDIDLKDIKENNDNTNRIEQLACFGGTCSIE